MQLLIRSCCAAIVSGALFLTLAAPAMAQARPTDQDTSRVVVLDPDEYILEDSTLSFRLEEGAAFEPAASLEGWHYLPAIGGKVVLWIEDPTFGSHTVEATLPGDAREVLILRASEDGVKATTEVLTHIGFARRDMVPGNTPTPPPGQGCQLPNQLAAYFSDPTTDFLSADCFKPESDGYLTHLVFWGAYAFPFGGACSEDPPDDFTVTYYEDNGGQPGNILAGPFDVNIVEKFTTGNLILDFFPEWQYQTEFHAPVEVFAGQCIWVEIVNDTAFDPNCAWGWESAFPGDEVHWNNVQGILPDDQAFCTNILIQPGGCPPPQPGGDDCDDCVAIAGEDTFDFDNTSATSNGPGNALCDKFGTDDIDNDVWFCWTSPCDGPVTLSTCSLTDVDTKVAVYDGTNCNDLTNNILACNDDTCGLQSTVNWSAVAGDTYLLRIGTFPGAAGGTGQFSISCDPVTANDGSDGALLIKAGETVSGDTSHAGPEDQRYSATAIDGPGLWYRVEGNGRALTASTCNQAGFDTKLSVFCGSGDGMVPIARGDDARGCGGNSSQVSWCSERGATYHVLVHGFGGARGLFDLSLSSSHAPCESGGCTTPLSADVDSNLHGVFVRVLPLDLHGQAAGLTPFARSYNPLTPVELSAPLNWEGRELIGWRVGERVIRPREGRLSGFLQQNLRVEALYASGDTSQDAPFGR